jgi:hypothetical protein
MTEMTLTHAQPAAVPAAVPPAEFPLSTLCLKVKVGDVEMSWTLRGDDSDVARRLPRALATIKKLQEDGKIPQAARPEPQPPLEERADWCPIHQVAMIRQENDRGAWWSHRVHEGGYCKGKRRKAGA